MPLYDYVCESCHKKFEKVLTLTEHEKQKVACPHCGSKKVVQAASAFYAVTGKKS
jgi:putative FmdB family regulatory protein